jgi:hypothetical protein
MEKTSAWREESVEQGIKSESHCCQEERIVVQDVMTTVSLDNGKLKSN